MKNTKFVFENFDEFLNFMEDRINEASGGDLTDTTSLQLFLGSFGLDDKGKDALDQINTLAKKSKITENQSFTKEQLNAIINTCKRLTIQDKTTIESIEVLQNEIEYDNLIAGEALNEQKKRVPIVDLFTKVNNLNLDASYKSPVLDESKTKFTNIDNDYDKGYLTGSGPLRQNILVSNKGNLDFKKYMVDDPVKNSVTGEIPAPKLMQDAKKEKQKKWSGSFFLYYPKEILFGEGQEYAITSITPRVIPVTTVSQKLAPIVIQNNDVLFDVDKSILKEAGKNSIRAALSNVAAAKSITVTGGASQEGTLERNKQLCQERAEAVAEFLKTEVFKGADVKVSDKQDIQPAKPETDEEVRKTWRKVTLDIVGESITSTPKTEDVIKFEASTDKAKADKLKFIQTIITINGEIIS